MHVADTTSTQSTSKTKIHACLFCKKTFSCLTRHQIKVHRDEEQIMKIRALPVNSFERNDLLTKIRREGDSEYNRTVNMDERLVVRRPNQNKVEKYVQCSHCKGSFCPKNIARHNLKCTMRDPNRTRVLHRMRLLEQRQQAPDAHDILPKDDRKLVNNLQGGMHEDDISAFIKTDPAIVLLASGCVQLNRFRKDRHYNDREYLRYAGKLIYTIKTKVDESIVHLADCFRVDMYKSHVIKAINIITEYDPTDFSYKKPAVANLYQTILKDIFENYKDHMLSNTVEFPQKSVTEMDNVIRLHKRLYNRLVGKTARNCLIMNRLRKKTKLPKLNDVKIFTEFLKQQAKDAYNTLNSEFSRQAWRTLSQTVLVQLTVFNRRRVGEVSRITFEMYQDREGTSPELLAGMSTLEKVFAEKYVAVKLLGKRERHLCVLVDIDQVQSIELLLKYRVKANVDSNNKYLFANTGTAGYFNAGIYIREFSEMCGAEDPSSLRATLLRKQVATMAQLMNLNANSIETLAKFMGHSLEVHRFNYRLTEMPLLGAKLANFFSTVGEADFSKFRGKTLEDLEPLLEDPEYNDDDDYPQPLDIGWDKTRKCTLELQSKLVF